MASITLKGREIPLIYTVYEMKEIQEEIAPLGKFQYLISGQNPDDKDDMSGYGSAEHLGAIAKLIRILGNKKVLRAMKPGDMVNAINACVEALAEGMASEIPEKESNEPVDVTLEEMKKKKAKEN